MPCDSLYCAPPPRSAAPRVRSRPEPFEHLKSLAGDWEADLPGFGKIQDSVRLVSKGTAIEETIGTPADNETSIYTRDGKRIVMTHYCALTPDGHQVRFETAALEGSADRLEFVFVGSTNLHDPKAPHMRHMTMSFAGDHLSERWTKTEAGKDTTFELNFTRR